MPGLPVLDVPTPDADADARPVWRRVPPRRALDIALVLAIFAGGAWWGAGFERAWHAAGNTAQYYQGYFEPAVMVACGRGLVASALPTPVPGLREFLDLRADAFDCSRIPDDLPVQPHGMHALYYLMHAVGWTWRLTGVSWSGLAPLFGILFGSVLALAFGLFRLGMGVPLALLGTFALAVSSVHLTNLPHLRDYAKAPFVLALILLMAWMVRGEARRRRVLGLAAVSGVVLGFGYGFRTDLLANIPPLLVTIALFLRGGPHRHLWLKTQAVGVCLAAFLLVSWPVVNHVTDRGGCQWHVVLLGFSSFFDDNLRITPASYEWGPYSDAYVHTAVGSFYRRGADSATGPAYCSPEYDQLTATYLAAIALTFSGDIATRAVAAMGGVLDLPAWGAVPLPGYAEPFYDRWTDVQAWLAGWGPTLAVPIIIAIAAVDLRLALWTLAMLLWFGSLPMLQFHNRHYFHLEWMGWAVFGVLASAAGRGGLGLFRRLRGTGGRGGAPPARRLRNVMMMTACCVAVGAGIVAARTIQKSRVGAMVEQARVWTAQPVRTLVEPLADGLVALTPSFPGRRDVGFDPMFWAEYLRIDIDPAACGPDGTVTARYLPPHADSTRTWPIQSDTAVILTPVFKSFQRLEAPGEGCVPSLHRAPNLRMLPAWVSVVVPSNPADLRALQSHGGPARVGELVETGRFALDSPGRFALRTVDVLRDLVLPPWGRPRVFAQPDRYVTRPEMTRVRYAVDDAAIGFEAPSTYYTAPGWTINVAQDEPYAFLLVSWPQHGDADARLLVNGHLAAGGITVGILKHGRWLDYVNVTRPGRFAVVIEPSAEGPYDIIIANNQRDGAVPTRATIGTIAWIEPTSGAVSEITP